MEGHGILFHKVCMNPANGTIMGPWDWPNGAIMGPWDWPNGAIMAYHGKMEVAGAQLLRCVAMIISINPSEPSFFF